PLRFRARRILACPPGLLRLLDLRGEDPVDASHGSGQEHEEHHYDGDEPAELAPPLPLAPCERTRDQAPHGSLPKGAGPARHRYLGGRAEAFDDQRGSATSQGYPVAEPDGNRCRDPLIVQERAVLRSGVAHGQPARRSDRELRVDPGYDGLGRVDRLDLAFVTAPDPDAHPARLVVSPSPGVEERDSVRARLGRRAALLPGLGDSRTLGGRGGEAP